MYKWKDSGRILDLIDMMIDSIHVIQVRTSHIKDGNDFLLTPDDMFVLDGVCMKLIFIGESVKTIDKLSEGELFPLYPVIPWKEIMKLRDVIAHHYFKIDIDIVDINGIELLKDSRNNISFDQKIIINLSFLKDGLYFINTKQENNYISKKIQINKN